MKTMYRLNSDVVVQLIEGEAVMVAPQNALISSLNKTGTFIIELLQQGDQSFESLYNSILEMFDVNESEATKDLSAFLEQMKESKLVIEV